MIFFISLSLAHMQSNAITGRCNKELEFHKYDVENVQMKCFDDYDCKEQDVEDNASLQELQLKDIVMPQKFEMLRNKKLHFYGFDGK